MKANKKVANEPVMADNTPMHHAKPVSAARLAELESTMKLMIQCHGFATAIATIEESWERHEMTWDAYQQLINVMRNVNNQLAR